MIGLTVYIPHYAPLMITLLVWSPVIALGLLLLRWSIK